MDRLTLEDIEMIIGALDMFYTKVDNTSYPSYEFRLQRKKEVYDTRQKMRDIKKELKDASKS